MDARRESRRTQGRVNMLENALEGTRVLDFTQLAAGPICTMHLGDMGADVIKVEARQGDLGRKLGPPWAHGESVTFLAMNRNKRSVSIDLKKPESCAIVKRLVHGADVVVESFRPGVMDRLGLGYLALRAVQKDLVYCSISAYGQEGPWRDKPGVDGVLQAVSGLMSITGKDGSPPSKALTPTVDMVTGFLAVNAITAALLKRHRTGEGQQLDVNMLASSIMLQQTSLAAYLHTRKVPIRCGSAAPYAAPNEAFLASDGYLMIAAYQSERWLRLCDAIGRSELTEDPRFADNSSRVANRADLVNALNATLSQHTRSHWVQLLESADVICSPVCDYSEVTTSEQATFANLFVPMNHPTTGTLTVPGFCLGGPTQPGSPCRRPPALGEHTAEVMQQLGFDDEEINQLTANNVIFQPTRTECAA